MTRRRVPGLPLPSTCPIAAALALLGDPWTLLLVRDVVLHGKGQHFDDFLVSPEGISSGVLSHRLRTLVLHGILRRRIYQRRPVRTRYEPTALGLALRPVLAAMSTWGEELQARNSARSRGTAERRRRHAG